MTEFTAAHFDEVCNSGPVRDQIASIEAIRSKAVKQFWLFLIGGLVATAVLAIVAANFASWLGGLLFFVGVVASIVMAMRPLDKARHGLKLPMLQALAERGGMSFAHDRFEPPYYLAARKALFGNWLSNQDFSDLFEGKDADGKGFAFYEAHLQQGSGKNRTTVFQGQMYGFETAGGGAVTVITPDKGLFNFFKPGKDMQRVKFETHPEFEKKFEVYSTDPAAAQGMLGSPTLRNRLLEMRARGRLFGYVDGQQALFAITGRDRFEPGSMFRASAGTERARLMFDDVCAALATIKELKAAFGGSSRWTREEVA